MSRLRGAIRDYLALRRSLGFRLRETENGLRDFAAFLEAQGAPHITKLIVRQSGEDDGPRWQRYFEVVSAGWRRALGELKSYLDKEAMRERR